MNKVYGIFIDGGDEINYYSNILCKNNKGQFIYFVNKEKAKKYLKIMKII